MNKYKPHLILIFFLIIYLIFPTNNSTVDAYAYAALIKYGKELFHPHHLLYNAFGYMLVQFVNFIGWYPDVLAFMKAINGIAAVLCLWIFYKILKELGREKNERLLLLLLCGSSFSIWRFATENETYIIPIVFSLLSSLYFLRFTKNTQKKQVLLAGGFAAVACLFHQIHVFWWLGLLIGILLYYRRFNYFLFFTLPAIVVPVGYLLVIIFEQNSQLNIENIVHFVFREFYTGGVDTSFELNNILLFCINLFRSFIQVHGFILIMLKKNILFVIPLLIFFFLMIRILLLKNLLRLRKSFSNDLFMRIHIMIIILQLLFAIYSVGNAEFMVMIPFLLLIILSYYLNFNTKALFYLGIAFFTWNLCYGILPNYSFSVTNNEMVTKKVLSNPQNLYVLFEDIQVQNEIYYLSDEFAENIQKSPSALEFKGRNINEAKERIDSCLNNKLRVFTDCIDRPKVINRASMVINSETDHEFFSNYELIKVDSTNTYIGKIFLFEVKKK